MQLIGWKTKQQLQRAKNALAPSFEGHLDSVVGNEVAGWAYDGRDPKRRLLVEVSRGERRVIVAADMLRKDVLDAGKGDGRYGLNAHLDATGLNQFPVRARLLETGFELAGSPWSDDIVSQITREGDKLLSLISLEAELARASIKRGTRDGH